MTDKFPPEDAPKTTAELEAEARERARAAMAGQASEQKTPPGQPEVTRFRKPAGRRTLLVSLLSLALLMALALGGDYFLTAMKNGDEKTADAAGPPSAGAARPPRTDLGMDENPFSLFAPQKPETMADNARPQSIAPPSPTPSVLNKAAALADGPGNVAETAQPGATRSAPSEPRNSAATAREPHAAATRADGDQDNPGVAKVTGVRRLNLDPDLYIPVDRYIPCSMMRRFVSDVGGALSCLISEDVYSASHHVKLIPAGTVARGVYRTGALQHGRGRLFVLWTELRTPEPGSLQIPLVDTQASGQLGEAGIAGWVDSHFWTRFGNALMLSTVQDVAAAASDSAPGKDRNTDYTENTRAATAEMAKTTLENSINIPPTMYLNQGDIIGIMTGTDIDFSSVYQLRLKTRWYAR
ncbi:VirB10/TraB/TrbI family type IV secretion system protein [Brenneria rubrifaciens]|uniref:TrbI/VirB10 family protein n=1 Tax=Brenneria rubrifaciens TaxID=55213 RepID=A0A4V1F9N1_9GAMM|nr:VirB10/TraB/TrbI family type IV secretion system protein [Brenneria rubrifaciens]QCR08153.1 TrbI/VirB10 family protein [Brenneria rubrifaciens]QCR09020.1 TrbI/VirB10 family protein [Brenneria rubrifaciens]